MCSIWFGWLMFGGLVITVINNQYIHYLVETELGFKGFLDWIYIVGCCVWFGLELGDFGCSQWMSIWCNLVVST